jgi:hypothetical protein
MKKYRESLHQLSTVVKKCLKTSLLMINDKITIIELLIKNKKIRSAIAIQAGKVQDKILPKGIKVCCYQKYECLGSGHI